MPTTTIHLAGEPRNDGSQRCSRCGLEIVAAGHTDHWPVDHQIAGDEQEGDGLTVRAQQSSDGDLPLCMSPSAPDPTAQQPHRLGDDE